MLYDNAAAARSAGPGLAGDPRAALCAAHPRDRRLAAARDAAAGRRRRLRQPLDADSEGEEGKFYVWTEAEIDDVLGADARAVQAAYDVTADGNWEGHTILNRMRPPAADDAADRGGARAARAPSSSPARDSRVRPDSTTRCWPIGTG